MPSLQDSVVIFILALILVGPKNLPKLARQLGKLMAEFRRASNEFRMQMEDELRVEEQKEHQAKVEAMAGPPSEQPEADFKPEPIAESGELKMMPPSTGLPVESANYGTSPEPVAAIDAAESEYIAEATPQHSILPPEHTTSAGISSDEPAAENHEQTHA
jgi:sec-independent protein translocase protein TatB